ncbi:UDP-N-acetylmuramoyl-L-alanyl-D-glutamate--2, 6-diaminopimelate ligase [Vibrio aerogenes CECT 7868]|uniref:UDP-N-acetylmuramoyl-L-alanyl-D-glutamate--2,6-diaminopimelate ligase n=1 Tax=Vibrio aerogenes CECT 7868 TaxID=1216006 RepID=A0A1M5WSE6_9VIBR|nr:UDP-N-acetylmuramoyl-L-alanyl-D-glutamate--2,6-diaminopimelate ligase [Vibrio aerogenes]SHH90312.1 UDP-N-acetylmuramoyl-L-alanyl-D-glutamate--2, 6-diaminopimelate ligase [Vibrio aerogenes CECT 7868]
MANDRIVLSKLISPWIELEQTNCPDFCINHLELDSRQIGPGDTFVAIIGHQVDGRNFIASAASKGANLVLAQSDAQHPHGETDLVEETWVLYLDDLGNHLSELAGRLYSHPSHQHYLVAVTGTNGKTTISQLIAQWLTLSDKKAAVMGTAGNGFPGQLKPATNTTGSAVAIQKNLSELLAQDTGYTAMEVSSHGLVQGRVKALSFDVGIFSNLSRDHLDYHGDMDAYGNAKKLLFTTHQCRYAVINADDPLGKRWLSEMKNAVAVSLVARPDATSALWATEIQCTENGMRISFDGSWGAGTLSVPLIGAFNACNVLLAMAALLVLGIDKMQLMDTAPQLLPVIGRMELFHVPGKAKLVVDYAHTPDALEKALVALRGHCHGQLWAIFGCGGNRDKGKRPMMARTAASLADKIVLTDDNPRNESPEAIIEEMKAGLSHTTNVSVEHSRYEAIKFALEHSQAQDIILIAGKGHEDYQVTSEGAVHYSDRESAQHLLGLTL